jgi:para-aminobenzoate synthetase component 1
MIWNKPFFNKINDLSKKGKAFLFIIDFEGKQPVVYPLDNLPKDIHFKTPGLSCESKIHFSSDSLSFKKRPVSFEEYRAKFDIINSHIRNGDTYLINLTQPTKVDINLDLISIYYRSLAPYKLFFQDKFVVFSPESFIKIKDDKIFTYPMKGTIDCNIPNAESILLNDPKEISEHNTIVDLMRNDLSMVSRKVKVDRFRYIETLKTHEKNIIQTSSQISGHLQKDYRDHIGDILSKILPAGSITGAPKEKTVKIILDTEGYQRGYYTGVFGIFDGQSLDSAVMIRYVEKNDNMLTFKSGGGITLNSEIEKEYQEMIDKVYVPIT